MVHDVLKNELAAGVLPCGRFGANAAWLRLAVITHNVLTALKRLALPAEYLSARPKRLRFVFLNLAEHKTPPSPLCLRPTDCGQYSEGIHRLPKNSHLRMRRRSRSGR